MLVHPCQLQRYPKSHFEAIPPCERLRPAAKEAAPALLELLKQKEDEHMRELASRSFGAVVGPGCKDLLPTLIEAYKKADGTYPRLECTILVALGKIGDKEHIVVPLLIEAVKNPKRIELRAPAAYSLGAMGPKAKAAVPALINALDVSMFMDRDNARAVHGQICRSLGEIGADARIALPALRKIASDAKLEGGFRRAAQGAIDAIEK